MVNDDSRRPRLVCSDVEANLMAYLKGGVGRALEDAIRAHLLHCESCAHRVQEARELDAALYAAAPRRPARLPADFSATVQRDVYRRMRRALVLRRTRALTARVVTVLVSVIFLVGLGLMLGPWLRFLAIAETMPTPAAVARQEQVPLSATAPAIPIAVTDTLSLEYQSPADSARALLEAAVAGDDLRVERLLVGTRLRARRVRARLEPCRGAVDVGKLRYSTVHYERNVAGVRIYYGGHLAGEVKYLLREDGYWYLHYLHYDSFHSILGKGCLALP